MEKNIAHEANSKFSFLEFKEFLEHYTKVTNLSVICQKKLWTVQDVADYLNVSTDYIYQLTKNKAINYYKPHGKLIYFDPEEIISSFKTNRTSTDAEIDDFASEHLQENSKEVKKWLV